MYIFYIYEFIYFYIHFFPHVFISVFLIYSYMSYFSVCNMKIKQMAPASAL